MTTIKECLIASVLVTVGASYLLAGPIDSQFFVALAALYGFALAGCLASWAWWTLAGRAAPGAKRAGTRSGALLGLGLAWMLSFGIYFIAPLASAPTMLVISAVLVPLCAGIGWLIGRGAGSSQAEAG